MLEILGIIVGSLFVSFLISVYEISKILKTTNRKCNCKSQAAHMVSVYCGIFR
jgi:hypothetical protein